MPGGNTVLAVRGADDAVGFYRWEFGDEERGRTANPAQTIAVIGVWVEFLAGAAGAAARGNPDSSVFPAERLEVGFLLRALQRGETLSMPHSRPMPSIGPRCHESRIVDERGHWRIIYRVDTDAIVIADVFEKKTRKTTASVNDACRRRLRKYDA